MGESLCEGYLKGHTNWSELCLTIPGRV